MRRGISRAAAVLLAGAGIAGAGSPAAAAAPAPVPAAASAATSAPASAPTPTGEVVPLAPESSGTVGPLPVAPPTENPAAMAADETLFRERLKEVRLIEIRSLRSPDAAEFEKGRRQILALADETYVGPLVAVLYGPNTKYRALLLDALKEFAGHMSKVARAYLQEIAVGDAASGNRRRAVEILRAVTTVPPTDRLMVHLAIDDVPEFRDRAAAALASLGEKKAAWLMIDRLVTEELKPVLGAVPVPVQSSGMSVQSVGEPRFRHATFQAATAGGPVISQTIDLPEVDVVDISSPLFSPSVIAVVGIERVQVPHPDMLAALRSLTGRNFGYDKEAWRKWMASPEGEKMVPAFKPMRFTTK
jgi:hypothetical protein